MRYDPVDVQFRNAPARRHNPTPSAEGPKGVLAKARGNAGPAERATGSRSEDDDLIAISLELTRVSKHEVTGWVKRVSGPACRHERDAHRLGPRDVGTGATAAPMVDPMEWKRRFVRSSSADGSCS